MSLVIQLMSEKQRNLLVGIGILPVIACVGLHINTIIPFGTLLLLIVPPLFLGLWLGRKWGASWFESILGFGLISFGGVFIASLLSINYFLADQDIITERYEIVDRFYSQGGRRGSSGHYIVEADTGDGIKQFSFSRRMAEDVFAANYIEVRVSNGFLGWKRIHGKKKLVQ